jgi:hypothetical protein
MARASVVQSTESDVDVIAAPRPRRTLCLIFLHRSGRNRAPAMLPRRGLKFRFGEPRHAPGGQRRDAGEPSDEAAITGSGIATFVAHFRAPIRGPLQILLIGGSYRPLPRFRLTDSECPNFGWGFSKLRRGHRSVSLRFSRPDRKNVSGRRPAERSTFVALPIIGYIIQINVLPRR